MKKKLFYVGIDVDQNSFSVAIIDIYTNQETFVKCITKCARVNE